MRMPGLEPGTSAALEVTLTTRNHASLTQVPAFRLSYYAVKMVCPTRWQFILPSQCRIPSFPMFRYPTPIPTHQRQFDQQAVCRNLHTGCAAQPRHIRSLVKRIVPHHKNENSVQIPCSELFVDEAMSHLQQLLVCHELSLSPYALIGRWTD
jgi:hypothetical protein